MPEIPDLNIYSRNLLNRVKGLKINNAIVERPQKLKNIDSHEFENLLIGNSFSDIYRSGKHIYFVLTSKDVFSVHLMLKGKFITNRSINYELFPQDDEINEIKHKTLSIEFDQNAFLVIADQLNWANITWNPKPSKIPDALDSSLNVDYIIEKMKENENKNIKEFLLNQKIIRGIGNAYSDEILYDSKISPHSKCGKIPRKEVIKLHKSIGKILFWAEEEILKINPDIISGELRQFLHVHNRSRKFTPLGEEILKEKVSSKNTYFTKSQTLYN